MTEKKKLFDRRMGALLALVLVAMLVIGWFAVGQDWLDGRKASETERRTRELYYGETSAAPSLSLISSASAEEGFLVDEDITPARTVTMPQDGFLSLYAQNPDVVGWLKAGENVDYPVVKRDNSFYMDHNFFGEVDRNGTLFINANNELDPRDDVLMIHGHNMKSGDMFGKLLSFRDEAYMRQYPIVSFQEVYGENEPNYVAVAAFDASMLEDNRTYFDITQIHFENDTPEATTPRQSASFQAYLDAIQERSYWKAPVGVTVDDHLLMLITCSYEQEDGRFVLVCRQLRENETPESVQALIAQ